ncbi:MAG: SH3 domain-containing protein [Muribaculaceae bacterium]|nr:SH3 domain-containing protein [Muribaculaceae bacterium]
MKKILALALLLVGFGVMNAQSMKMVVDSRGNEVGRYVKTNKTTFTVSIQDDVTVPRKGNRVVTYSAAKGQGIVYYNQSHTGSLNVRKRPTLNAPAITYIPDPKGDMPECYDCLGKVNGWYKVKVNGKVGYVRCDLLDWDGMCTM